MPSPFPGMDPWLEAPDLFPDVHAEFISELRGALNAVMPPGYVAVGNYLVWTDATDAARIPDVSLFGPRPTPDAAHGVETDFPGLVAIGAVRSAERREQPYLEIRADRGKRLVTAVEVLSPSNKVRGGRGRKAYLKKRAEFRAAGANLVEFDFLRAGAHTTAVPLSRLRKRLGRCVYHVGVVVAGSPDRLFVAPIDLADRLPTIGIPLDPGVSPTVVDLQALFDRCFDGGRYPELVRYDQPPDPPLSAEHAAWAAGVLRAKGL
ncbi:MAG: DUF4058 family protein, partial [Fimbriiglobus sp.]